MIYEYIDKDYDRLVAEYPFLLDSTGYCFAYNMPRGWWIAFGEQMCREIKDSLLASGGEEAVRNYGLIQVKEKFGGLRWYDYGGTKETDDIIDKYASLSEVTCCRCGKPATRLTTGWICPYCDDCGDGYAQYVPIERD